MNTHWEPESDEEPKGEQPELEYQVKAHIALEDSDGESWGIVKDTEGSLAWGPGKGATIGTWSRSPQDGLIHIFLETSIMALVDKSTLAFAKYAEQRRADVSTTKKGTRAPRVPKVEPGPSEEMVKIGNLRKLLGK